MTLGALLLAAVPAQAGPVEYRDVVSHSSAFGRAGGPSVDLRLRSFTQQQGTSNPRPDSVASATAPQDTKSGGPSTPGDGAAGTPGPLTGATVPAQDQQAEVTTIELGEVQGTLCDCGEIKIPGGGFPLWPLIGLAGVPLFFLPEDSSTPPTDTPTPPPPPTQPPPPQVPEPATLLLFGSGLAALGAGARRRRAQKSKLQQAAREV